ncbi:apolipoprotein N-acyltransferase [Niveibacterium terrae]|uniref:apolipoprotein N-acyltransferase n=1 Tax=Niveibacterium terrae TaxID=3373598 RepID=UPI003A921432
MPLRLPAPLLAVLGGLASVLAFAPFGLSPLMPACLALLAWLWRDAAPRRAAWLGFCWGWGAFFAGVGWLIVALHRYGGMPAPLAALSIALLAAYMALWPTLAGWLFARLRSRHWLADAALFAACWTTGEWLRGWVFTGFPWLAVGYSQTPPSPLAGFAPVLGVYGVGFLASLLAALAVFAWRERGKLAAAWVLVLGAGLALSLVSWTAPLGSPVSVALVQTNVPQEMKWDAERFNKVLNANLASLRDARGRIIVLPETALPTLLDNVPPNYLELMTLMLRQRGGEGVVGVFTRDGDGHIYNSAVTLGSDRAQQYSKRHLVPFGEFSPPMFGWFYQLAHIPMSDQSRGRSATPLAIAGQKLALNICYEDVFGEELIASLPEATLMLNISNLAWYGDFHAQPQHLQIARMRALETGRPMLRSTNTGMTAVVRPDGSVQAVLPAFTRGVLNAEVRGYQGLTPYARWGNWAILFVIACSLAVSLWRRRA